MSKPTWVSRIIVSIILLVFFSSATSHPARPVLGGQPAIAEGDLMFRVGQLVAGETKLRPDLLPTSVLTDPSIIVSEHVDEYAINSGLLYWAKRFPPSYEFPESGYLRRKPSRGGPALTLATTTSLTSATFHHLAADVDGIYYIDKETHDDPRQLEFRPTESPQTVLVLRNYFPEADYPVSNLRTDEPYLYWATSNGRILRLSKQENWPEIMAYTDPNPTDLVISNNRIYWIDNSGLRSMSKVCSPLPCTSITNHGSLSGGKMRFEDTFIGYYVFFVDTSIAYQRIRAYVCAIGQPCYFYTYYTAPNQDRTISRPAIGPCQTSGTCLYWHEFEPSTTNSGRLRRVPLAGGTAENIALGLPNTNQVETDDQGIYFFQNSPENVRQLARLPFTATTITRDLSFEAWEVTQGIQSLSNDVPLVAGKTTYVRVFASLMEGPPANDVEVVLSGFRGGTELPDSPLRSINPNRRLEVGQAYNREDKDSGWLFRLPRSWITSGNTVLKVTVDPRDFYDDINPANNTAMELFVFQFRPAACAIFMPVRTHTPRTSVFDPNFQRTVDLYKRLWPVPDVWVYYQTNDIAELEICWKWGFIPYPCYGPFELDQGSSWSNWIPDGEEALFHIGARAAFSDDPDECDASGAAVHYIGMVHPDAPTRNINGLAYARTWEQPASWVKMAPHISNPPNAWNWPTAGAILAHETSHNHGRKHVDCGNPEYIDSNYPYPPCDLDDDIPPDHFGFDINTLTPIKYTSASDYMSYNSPFWVSDYTYKAMFNRFSLADHDGGQPVSPEMSTALSGSVVLLSGAIDLIGNGSTLHHAWVSGPSDLSTGILAKWSAMQAPLYPKDNTTPLSEGDLRVRLLGYGDTVLADHVVEPLLFDPKHYQETVQIFMHTFPAPSEQVLRIELLSGSQVLASLEPGPAYPQLEILQPAGGETFNSQMTLSWRATDADEHDHLLHTVQYSPDHGVTWQNLTYAYPSHPDSDVVTLELSTIANLPGSNGENALIRVLTSDGYNTSVSTSPPFTVTDQPPIPFIISPDAGLVYSALESIPLRGGASDSEHGSVDPSSLYWQVDGRVFFGPENLVDGLAPGSHEIFFTAQDNGHKATISTSLQIGSLAVPFSSQIPVLNGNCEDEAYANALSLRLEPYPNGYQASLRLVRTSNHLWMCIQNLEKSDGPLASVGMLVDVNNSKDPLAQNNDYGFFVGENGTPFTRSGSGSGGMNNPGPGGLQAQVSASDSVWNAELRIDASILAGWNHMVGLGFGHFQVELQGNEYDYHWPYSLVMDSPITWAESALGIVPSISSLSPDSAVKGSQITLTIDGSQFSNTDTILWDGLAKTTTYVSSNQLKAEIQSSDLQAAQVVEVSVSSGVVSGYVSNPATFTVENPTPVLNTLSPNRSIFGLPGKKVTILGENFVPGASVIWNGIPTEVTYLSSNELELVVPGDWLLYGADVGVVVQNPSPGGGVSNMLIFIIRETLDVYLPILVR